MSNNTISAKEAANKWHISQRRVVSLCLQGRIPGAKRGTNAWEIPENSQKPTDARKKPALKKPDDARPFLKWVGGKSQLLDEIEKYYPFHNKEINKYAEPFVGGGAVLFDVLNKYAIKEIYISDINAELINTYKAIRDNPEELISLLKALELEFSTKEESNDRIDYYNEKRACFNELKLNGILDLETAALMIFLNKTSFNGVYRVNRNGKYNVPIGSCKNLFSQDRYGNIVKKDLLICDERNIINVSKKLKNAQIVCGDYKESEKFIDSNTFVYFDPPYRALTKTASFTSYTEQLFNDSKQIELAEYVRELDKKNARIVISNSDPKNENVNDDFFDDLYSEHNVNRISASRSINRNGDGRSPITELLISNYQQ